MKNCEFCQTGQMHPENVPSVQVINGQLIIIPDVPSLVCNHCQHTVLDPKFLEQVDGILSQKIPPPDGAEAADGDQSLCQTLLWSQIMHLG